MSIILYHNWETVKFLVFIICFGSSDVLYRRKNDCISGKLSILSDMLYFSTPFNRSSIESPAVDRFLEGNFNKAPEDLYSIYLLTKSTSCYIPFHSPWHIPLPQSSSSHLWPLTTTIITYPGSLIPPRGYHSPLPHLQFHIPTGTRVVVIDSSHNDHINTLPSLPTALRCVAPPWKVLPLPSYSTQSGVWSLATFSQVCVVIMSSVVQWRYNNQ